MRAYLAYAEGLSANNEEGLKELWSESGETQHLKT